MNVDLLVKRNNNISTNQYKFKNYGFVNYKINGGELCTPLINATQDNVFLVGSNESIPTIKTIETEYDNIKKTTDNIDINVEKVDYNSNEILRSLISLASKCFDYKNDRWKCKYDIFDKKILNWIKKYGLPFVGGPITKTVTPETIKYINNWDKRFCNNEFESMYYLGNVGCNYHLLRYQIERLYDVFLRLSAELYEDSKMLEINKHLSDNPYSKKGSAKNVSFPTKKWIIEKSIKHIQINTEISFNGSDIILNTSTENLLTLAFYQLILLFKTGDYKGVRVCECCHNDFIVQHGNQKFCGECSPQKNYAKKQREIKKKDGK